MAEKAQPTPPAAGQPPAPQPAQPGTYVENPGQTLGIIGIVLNAVGITIGGIILGALSRSKSKQAGMPTTLGTVSLVWGIVATALAFLFFVGWILLMIIAGVAASSGSRQNSDPLPSVDRDASSIYEQ